MAPTPRPERREGGPSREEKDIGCGAHAEADEKDLLLRCLRAQPGRSTSLSLCELRTKAPAARPAGSALGAPLLGEVFSQSQ